MNLPEASSVIITPAWEAGQGQVYGTLQEAMRIEHPELMKWSEKRLLDFFTKTWPKLDDLNKEYNVKTFKQKCQDDLNDREGIKVDISDKKLKHIRELFEKEETIKFDNDQFEQK